jgi:chemosensory pili system protein ChpA (sensor histidine kinase/response regulator)
MQFDNQSIELAPLTWVLPDLRKSFPMAVSALRHFSADLKTLGAGYVVDSSVGALRDVSRQFRQSRSALDMVGQQGVAIIIAALENLVDAFTQNPQACNENAIQAIEKATRGIIEFLEAVLKGRLASEVGLFPQYRELALLTNSPRIHPADLWCESWQWRDLQVSTALSATAADPRPKQKMDDTLSRFLNYDDLQAAGELALYCAGLARVSTVPRDRTFWIIAAAFFETAAYSLLAVDTYVKRTASQILQQLEALSKNIRPSERVAQDVAFFVLRATATDTAQLPSLQEVRLIYGDLEVFRGDYNELQYGRIDPVQLDYLRRRLGFLSESWSAWVAGDVSRSTALAQHIASVGESLLILNAQSDALVRALSAAVAAALSIDAKPNASLAIEVATTILYLEAVYDDIDQAKDFMGERSNALASRLTKVAEGLTPDAVEPWMEALYRRRSERHSMGSVTNELRVTLAAVESSLEKYRLDPSDSGILALISGYLSQMYGVFSALGLYQAANAVFKIREILDSHLANARRKYPIPIKVYEQIAGSVSTFGFLIDLLNYQIGIAKEMFFYDANSGEFRYLNGRGAGTQSEGVSNQVEPISQSNQALEESISPLQTLLLPDQVQYFEEDSLATEVFTDTEPEDERTILQIFLDEAKEVLEAAQTTLRSSDGRHYELSELSTLRRTFHTLKGGARMVELDQLGEAAWSFESLLTQWEDDNRQSVPGFGTLISQAVDALASWTQCIAVIQPPPWTAEAFEIRAKAMLLEQQLIPFDMQQDAGDVQHEDQRLTISSGKVSIADSDNSVANDLVPPSVVSNTYPHRLSEEFFEIFLSETSEWSLALLEEVSAWSLDQNEPDIGLAQTLAHSIRGNAAAVGIRAITDLAQALEDSMERLRVRRKPVVMVAPEVMNAAKILHELVLQSAHDRSPSSNAELLERLVEITKAESIDGSISNYGSLGHGEEGLKEKDVAPTALGLLETEGGSQALVKSPLRAAVMPIITTADSLEEDQLDSENTLDLDLLPIFQEEGAELIPALGTALRRWNNEPSEVAHRASVLRLLHTLKGSSRLAGALRMGELTHHMESAIEVVTPSQTSKTEIERFISQFDRLNHMFVSLGNEAISAVPHDDKDVRAPVADHPIEALSLSIDVSQSGVQTSLPSLIRVRAAVLERLVDEVGEIAVQRSRLDSHLSQITTSLTDLQQTLDRLAQQLRELELQADMRIQSRVSALVDSRQQFDPLEFDRFTRLQEIARMMAESVGDVATVRRNVQTALYASKEDLEQQARQTRELQRDLLRMRLVAFDAVADRFYGVVRQAAKELGKRVTLEIVGGRLEVDRSVLERMSPAFEHLLRNAVVHGIEAPAERISVGKAMDGAISISVSQEGNDVAVLFRDDGRGISAKRIRAKAIELGLLGRDGDLDEQALFQFVFEPGFSTSNEVSELAGRGIGLDVVLSEVKALGGRIETHSEIGFGTQFKLVFPLTTAVTQVLLFRTGKSTIGIPAALVEAVTGVPTASLQKAYAEGQYALDQTATIAFYASSGLLQLRSDDVNAKVGDHSLVLLRGAGQRIALHVDEVLGNREVVVKNLGPQLSRLPGLAGVTVLPSGATVFIYNPIALASVYGQEARRQQSNSSRPSEIDDGPAEAPLILVVDDAITVRRVIQRLLVREGYKVALAHDGLHALQVLEQQRPLMVLSDIEMPRMDGFELVRNIRLRAGYADLPIVMISSRIAQKHQDHAFALGANHYLGKPYSETQLLALIHKYAQATRGDAGLVVH